VFDEDEESNEDDGESVPSVDVPSVGTDVSEVETSDDGADPPATDDPTSEDVPAELQREFWTLVVVADAALIAFGLGALFVVFRGNVVLGASLLVAAAGIGFYARERYRTVQETDWETKDA